MGYHADGDLTDLFPAALIDIPLARIPAAVGDAMLDKVKRRTPVAKMPAAYEGNTANWLKDRKGRPPGSLRAAWERGDVIFRGDVSSVEVRNPDPVAILVEDDTRPHLIRPKPQVIGVNKDGTPKLRTHLRFPGDAGFAYAREVDHPGTQGVHMLRDTLAELEATWPTIGQPIVDEVAASLSRRP